MKSLDWHPSRKILAAGWENGEVVIWNENDHELHETAMHHKVEVNIIQWKSIWLATGNCRFGIIFDNSCSILLTLCICFYVLCC